MNRSTRLASLLALAALLAVPRGRGQEPAAPARPAEPAAPGVRVRVDPRVELACVVFRLAGHPEYNRARTRQYVEAVEAQFEPFRDHPAVRRARALRAAHGIGYDACMSLAVHLADDGSLSEAVPLDPRPESLDSRWTPADARAFIAELRDFAAASDFAGFFARQRNFYDVAEGRMRALIERQGHLGWFPAFFGARPGARFEVVLAPLNGPNNYGPHVRRPDGTEELYAILGAWFVDAEGRPTYDADVLETLVHEFTHSYTNPLVDRFADRLRRAGEALYARVAPRMERQAYGHWTTMLRETLVRACTLRYIRAHRGPLAATARALEERSRRFDAVPPLAALLAAEYEPHRDRYPTLESLMPRVVEFFDAEAAATPAEPADHTPRTPGGSRHPGRRRPRRGPRTRRDPRRLRPADGS